MGRPCAHGRDSLHEYCALCSREIALGTDSEAKARRELDHLLEVNASLASDCRGLARERDDALARLQRVREWAEAAKDFDEKGSHPLHRDFNAPLAVINGGELVPPGLSAVAPSGHTWMYEHYMAAKVLDAAIAEAFEKGRKSACVPDHQWTGHMTPGTPSEPTQYDEFCDVCGKTKTDDD